MMLHKALIIATLAFTVVPARGGAGHGSHGWHGHSGYHHHHFHHFVGFPFIAFPLIVPFFPFFPYGYPCVWEEGHWEDQVYEDKFGNSTHVPTWVPGQWLCPAGDA